MRLLDSRTIQFREFADTRVPEYAILSHTWGEDEVTFTDIVKGRAAHRSASDKIRQTCAQAAKDGYDYVWIDTCCIDKSSSAELSEAINAMYSWYGKAGVCYAYLVDVPTDDDPSSETSYFAKSRWFTRGWTLQELLAPVHLRFFAQDWTELGSKITMQETLASVTAIDKDFLAGTVEIKTRSLAQRMSWASRRNTTRTEDIAYCLMGIFDVNMPLLYGEGGVKAFIRLQEEIIRQSDDQTSFAWANPKAHNEDLCGLLAESPAYFELSGTLVPYRDWGLREPYSMSNKGLRIRLKLLELKSYKGITDVYQAELECPVNHRPGRQIGILLKRTSIGCPSFSRIFSNRYFNSCGSGEDETIYVRQSVMIPGPHDIYPTHRMLLGKYPTSEAGYMLRGIYNYTRIPPEIMQIKKTPDSKYTSDMRWSAFDTFFEEIRRTRSDFTFAIIFERRDGRILIVLLGSIQGYDVGFDAVTIPSSGLQSCNGWAYNGDIGIPQECTKYDPRPVDTVKTLHDHRVCVRANLRIIENAKCFTVDVEIEAIYHESNDQHSEPKGVQKFKDYSKPQFSQV